MEKGPVAQLTRRAKMQKMKHLVRGEETVHNKLQYGQYGVQVSRSTFITSSISVSCDNSSEIH